MIVTFPGQTHLYVDQKVDEIFADYTGMYKIMEECTAKPSTIYITIFTKVEAKSDNSILPCCCSTIFLLNSLQKNGLADNTHQWNFFC